MTSRHQHQPHLFTQIDVTPAVFDDQEIPSAASPLRQDSLAELCTLMREMLAAQDRQNELLEELVVQFGANHRQRQNELLSWQQANPELANFCRRAADKLGKIQTDYLVSITEEVEYGFENLRDGDYMLSEFVDRFGPRFAHLNGLFHVLSQLGTTADMENMPKVTKWD